MSPYRQIAALALALTTVGGIAHAASGTENDALAIDKAQISLSQAVTTAEQSVSGKASRAEYERTTRGWAYDVEVVGDSKVYDVKVNAQDGSVIRSTEDSTDRDDADDPRD